jgi:hypothetical protein
MASSLNVSAAIVNRWPGLGSVAANDEDVYTKRLILGSFADARKAFRAPLTALGIAMLASGEAVMSFATWIKPVAP